MKRSLITSLAFSTILLTTSNLVAEPPNLSLLIKDIHTYHDSGNYDRELIAVIDKAQHYIDSQVRINNQRKHKRKLALVLDIDETSLTNYDKMVKRDFYGNHEQIHQEILAADAPAIQPMLSLYRHALKQGIKIFFVTGRRTAETDATKTNLLRAGYKDWSGLYMRPDGYHYPSVERFKAHARALICQDGYTVIATIGDQYSDLLGGFAQKEFKLPNPFYYLP